MQYMVSFILYLIIASLIFLFRRKLSLCLKKYKWANIIDKSYWYYFAIVYGILYLIMFYSYKFEGINIQDKWYNFLDPIASIMTFITTLAIFYMQAKTKWENSIEKRLSVTYIFVGNDGDEDNVEVAKIIDAYLPSESDARAWAQSLGSQIMGNLDFDMHWDESKSKIEFNEKLGDFVKRYSLKVYLTTDPRNVISLKTQKEKTILFEDPEKIIVTNDKLEKFKNKKFKHSKLSQDEKGCLIWEEKY